MEYIHHYDSPLGGITIASDGIALTGLWFDGQKYFAECLDKDHEEKDLPVFEQTDQWLDIYFSGKAPEFTPPIDMKTTPFRKAVWEILLTIPFGSTMTYGEIADRIASQKGISGMSAQAVGGAVGHNAISLIIPCHRVVGANGSLTGYAGGIDKKEKLLSLEKADVYKELGALTKDRKRWKESIPYVSSFLNHESVKLQAKALWLLGETGYAYPLSVNDHILAIASFCDSPEPLLRERAVNALGRIGRGSYQAIEPYWEGLFRFASDTEPKVRLSFIWASENIAANTPGIYENYMPVFEKLLYDVDDKVRMEAPEIFRVLGKRRPEFVRPFIEQLQEIAETDDNRVVRIHCLGAIRASVSE